jgi:hypothetical protein
MAEYPVHNYGTNPIGQLGLKMISDSMDWDEKKKLLETQAITETLKSNRELFVKRAETGDLPAGFESRATQYGIDPVLTQGMGQQNERAKFQNYLKELGQTADLSEKKQKYNSAEIEKYTKSLEYWQKKKTEAMDAGTSPVSFNDNLEMIGQKLTELTGQQFDPVLMTDISEIKKYKETVAIGEVSKLESQVTQAMAGEDPKALAAARSALSGQIMTSSKQLGISKDTFASANDLLSKADEALKSMLTERVKPKPLKPQDLGDKIGMLDEQGNVVKTIPKTAAPRSPEDMDKIYTTRDNKIISDAHREAAFRVKQKFGSGIQVTMVDGQPQISMQGNEDAEKYYDETFSKLKQDKRQRAIQLKQIPATYQEMEQEKKITSPSASPTGYQTADDVRAAFKAGKLPKLQAAKILKDQFGFK